MARSKKIPIDYFNLSVHFWDEMRTKKLTRKYGTAGVIVYLKLTAEVFKNSFYLPFDKEDFELFSFELDIETDEFLEILDYLMKLDFFDKQIFEQYQVITSKEIQEQYFTVKKRNKAKLILSDFEQKLLISDGNNESFQENSAKNYGTSEKNNEITNENRKINKTFSSVSAKTDGNSQNANQTTSSIPQETDGNSQNSVPKEKKSKVKKSKGERSKEKENSVGNSADISDGTENSKTLSLSKNDFEKLKKEIIPLFAENLRPDENSEEEKKWALAYAELQKHLTPEEINRLITFGLEDEFWQKNFHALYFLTKPAKSDGVPIWRKMYTQMQSAGSHKNDKPSVKVNLSNLKTL